MEQRKWEFITEKLIELKAPKKVINAANEIDNIMVELGLGWNTEDWNYYTHKYNTYYQLNRVVGSIPYCTACVDVKHECCECKLGGTYNGVTSCIPRSKYPDDYYKIVYKWLYKKVNEVGY